MMTLSIEADGFQALLDHAIELERKADLVRQLSEEIRERIIVAELASSLAHEDERSVDLLKSALLIARLDNEDFDLDSYLKRRKEWPRRSGRFS